MKKELGKWLMDIAKYITTAVVLTSIFGEVEQQWIIYAGGTLAVALSLGWGLYLVRDKKEGVYYGSTDNVCIYNRGCQRSRIVLLVPGT